MRYERFDWSGYFDWLVEQVNDGDHDDMFPVLLYLHKKEFDWSRLKSKDENRASDAVLLRIRYADEYDLPCDDEDLDVPPSVLEVLVRLAIDLESNVMGIPGEERPDIWFWEWLENLEIDERCTGKGFDKGYLDNRIDTWLKGDISRTGKRSPFPLYHSHVNQKSKDIWSQCMAYVNEKIRYW